MNLKPFPDEPGNANANIFTFKKFRELLVWHEAGLKRPFLRRVDERVFGTEKVGALVPQTLPNGRVVGIDPGCLSDEYRVVICVGLVGGRSQT